MIMFRKDTSFPYLKIARECGVPYGTVIRAAEAIENRTPIDPHINVILKIVIAEAVEAEQKRRAEVAS